MPHIDTQYIYCIKPDLSYLTLLKNRLKNYEFYCLKVKIGRNRTEEFKTLNDIKIISYFKHALDKIRCWVVFVKEYDDFYKSKVFDIKFKLDFFIKCLKCGSFFDSEERFNFHKKYCC